MANIKEWEKAKSWFYSDSLFKHESEKLFFNAINKLNQREKEILLFRFEKKKTLKEVSVIYSVSSDRVRQIENQALRRLCRIAHEILL